MPDFKDQYILLADLLEYSYQRLVWEHGSKPSNSAVWGHFKDKITQVMNEWNTDNELSQFFVKCDEENNPPDNVCRNKISVHIHWSYKKDLTKQLYFVEFCY